jgi:hypothetical protein
VNQLKKIAASALGVAALVVLAGTGHASATTLEVGGVTQNKAVEFNMAVPLSGSAVLSKTDGSEANTCNESRIRGKTTTFSGTRVTGGLSTLNFIKCKNETVVVHSAGQLYIEHESGTTNGNVFSENAQFTVPTSFGFVVTCKTGEGTKIGTLTGSGGGFSSWTTLHVSAVLDCGFLMPSLTWKGTYTSTWTDGLGVVA